MKVNLDTVQTSYDISPMVECIQMVFSYYVPHAYSISDSKFNVYYAELGLLNKLAHLTELHLFENSLSYIHARALPPVQQLTLYNNNLTSIPEFLPKRAPGEIITNRTSCCKSAPLLSGECGASGKLEYLDILPHNIHIGFRDFGGDKCNTMQFTLSHHTITLPNG